MHTDDSRDRWTVEPGRALHFDGVYALSIAPADRNRAGLGAAELDAMARAIARVLNAANVDPRDELRAHMSRR